jgi:16S rRNA (guanine527-N7)-methyltransferase
LDSKQEKQIFSYKSLLVSWNHTHNLVSKNQATNLEEHISDSLSISPFLGENVIDLGSGGGLPGIPLAISNPDKKFFLVESNTKKSAFLLNVSTKLQLSNVTVYNQRIEDITADHFPQNLDIVCRAVGTTDSIIGLTKHLFQNNNTSLRLMKTQDQFETESLPPQYTVKKIDKFPSKAKEKTRILVTIEAVHKNG